MRLCVDGEELDFDPRKLLNVEAIAITKATGIAFADFGAELQKANFELISAIVWVVRKRQNPQFRLTDVVFEVGSFSLRDDVEDDAGPKARTGGRSTTRRTSRSSRSSSDSGPGTSTG